MTGGGEQAEEHARDRGVHAGLQEGEPDGEADQRVNAEQANPEPGETEHEGETRGTEEQGYRVDARAVSEGDDQDGADVVRDREREDRDAKPVRDARPEHRQASD